MSDNLNKPAAAAVKAKLDDLGMGAGKADTATASQAAAVAAVAVAAAPATQVRRPWRSTVRTVFQLVVGLAPMMPVIVAASGVDETLPAVGLALGISAGVTRIMNLPAVEDFLQRFVPWLAATPKPTPADDTGHVDTGGLLTLALALAIILILLRVFDLI